MAIYYHGTSAEPFEKFSLDHALEGDGKVKFGFGVYVTSKYSSAAHYSGANPSAKVNYVYTVAIPEVVEENHLGFKEPVSPVIISKTERKLGEKIPVEACQQGSLFRKYLANRLTGNISTVKKMTGKADLKGEKVAAKFLVSIGVDLLIWPTNWKRPEDGLNCAVMDETKVRILQLDTVALDDKKKLIEGSISTVRKY